MNEKLLLLTSYLNENRCILEENFEKQLNKTLLALHFYIISLAINLRFLFTFFLFLDKS